MDKKEQTIKLQLTDNRILDLYECIEEIIDDEDTSFSGELRNSLYVEYHIYFSEDRLTIERNFPLDAFSQSGDMDTFKVYLRRDDELIEAEMVLPDNAIAIGAIEFIGYNEFVYMELERMLTIYQQNMVMQQN